MTLAVDASVVAKLLIPERYSDRAQALFRDAALSDEHMIAPTLLSVEMTSVIRCHMRDNRLSLLQATGLLDDYLALPIDLLSPVGLHHEALRLTAAHSLGAHDAHYVALAAMNSCELWVDDERLLRAVRGRLPFVRWIGDYPLPTPP